MQRWPRGLAGRVDALWFPQSEARDRPPQSAVGWWLLASARLGCPGAAQQTTSELPCVSCKTLMLVKARAAQAETPASK